MGGASRLVVSFALASLAAACGGGDDDFVPPTCGENELALEGTIGGEPVSVRIASEGYVWVNFPDNGVYDNPYVDVRGAGETEPILHLEWDRGLPRDMTTDAFGHVRIPSEGLEVGNCADDGFVSIITAREDGADFLLRDLSAGPPCQGEPVSGELAGCVRSGF